MTGRFARHAVVLVTARGREEVEQGERVMCMVGGDLTLCGEHTMRSTDDVLLNRTGETHVILLASVTSIRLTKKRNGSSSAGLSGAGWFPWPGSSCHLPGSIRPPWDPRTLELSRCLTNAFSVTLRGPFWLTLHRDRETLCFCPGRAHHLLRGEFCQASLEPDETVLGNGS